jgi:hypothetical protein
MRLNQEQERSIISKRIRAGSISVHVGIDWQPKNDKDHINIRNLRNLVEEANMPLP